MDGSTSESSEFLVAGDESPSQTWDAWQNNLMTAWKKN